MPWPEKRAEVLRCISRADALLSATPVYTFTVPSQPKQFVEILFRPDHAAVIQANDRTFSEIFLAWSGSSV